MLAIQLAQNQLAGADVQTTLLEIIRKGVEAYYVQQGQPIDPQLLDALKQL